nr:GMC family oxidoreductase [Verrucomicrobiota bacterium]
MKNPIGGEFEEPPDHEHHLGSMQTIDLSSMRRYSPNEELDYLVVGVGAAGGVLLQRLARAGFRVAGLEAGP